MEHIADDIRKVLRRNHFFFITQFDNPLGNLAHRVLVDIDPQCFKVLTDIRLTGSLAKSIFADTAETFGQQIIAIQIVFAVTISMDTGTLRKDMFPDNRFVRRNMNTGESFHQSAGIIDPFFPKCRIHSQLIFQHGKHTAKRGIPSTLSQSVQCSMKSFYTGTDSRVDIRYRQIIVVMSMKIELQVRIACNHFLTIFVSISRVQDAKRIRQHETPDRQVTKRIDCLKDIFRRVFNTVRPIFQIDVHSNLPFDCLVDDGTYIGKMLFGSLTKLFRHVLIRALAKQVYHTATSRFDPV